ncbi:hypothetical protein VP01_610g2 [Puccinia sorghi]|uniref:Uncharacterized protein n=1 Tax=Puccinia sorghi TaxID=27349 RepID=A0A0L6UH14_9BASI|nr:hypothetical protein VP01_610g2 [Puccinia sorghi]
MTFTTKGFFHWHDLPKKMRSLTIKKIWQAQASSSYTYTGHLVFFATQSASFVTLTLILSSLSHYSIIKQYRQELGFQGGRVGINGGKDVGSRGCGNQWNTGSGRESGRGRGSCCIHLYIYIDRVQKSRKEFKLQIHQAKKKATCAHCLQFGAVKVSVNYQSEGVYLHLYPRRTHSLSAARFLFPNWLAFCFFKKTIHFSYVFDCSVQLRNPCTYIAGMRGENGCLVWQDKHHVENRRMMPGGQWLLFNWEENLQDKIFKCFLTSRVGNQFLNTFILGKKSSVFIQGSKTFTSHLQGWKAICEGMLNYFFFSFLCLSFFQFLILQDRNHKIDGINGLHNSL